MCWKRDNKSYIFEVRFSNGMQVKLTSFNKKIGHAIDSDYLKKMMFEAKIVQLLLKNCNFTCIILINKIFELLVTVWSQLYKSNVLLCIEKV